MKLNDRNKWYAIIVNFISVKILAKKPKFNIHLTLYVYILCNNVVYLGNLSQVNNCNWVGLLAFYSPKSDI